jgi:hypothetical protein
VLPPKRIDKKFWLRLISKKSFPFLYFDSLFKDIGKRYGFDVPCRQTVASWVLAEAPLFMTWLKNKICSEAKHGFAITCDGWTLQGGPHFLGVTVHYLTSDFILRSIAIALEECGQDATQIGNAIKVSGIYE